MKNLYCCHPVGNRYQNRPFALEEVCFKTFVIKLLQGHLQQFHSCIRSAIHIFRLHHHSQTHHTL